MSIVGTFIDKCLSLSRLGKNWFNNILHSMIEAGRTISYVETVNQSQSDTLHLAIKQCDNKAFMHEFEKVVRFALVGLKLKNRNVKVAFDTTEDVTWCKNNNVLRPSVYNHPLLSWQYLNVSIVDPYFVPLMSIPYTQLDDLDFLVIDLLNYIRTLPIKLDLILFDRGFYHAHLIDYLNNKKGGNSFPYLILIPEREAQKGYIQRTRDKNKKFAFYKHVFNYTKDKSSWKPSTTIMVKIVDKKTAWCYATNKNPSLSLIFEYRKRWNIETGFRIHDEARIKSKSNNELIRFFYHLLGMLLIILWRLQNTIKNIAFKRYLKQLEYYFYNLVNKINIPP